VLLSFLQAVIDTIAVVNIAADNKVAFMLNSFFDMAYSVGGFSASALRGFRSISTIVFFVTPFLVNIFLTQLAGPVNLD
jgi:hypothetical protein